MLIQGRPSGISMMDTLNPNGLGFRVSGLGFRVSGLGFRVSGLGFRSSSDICWAATLAGLE